MKQFGYFAISTAAMLLPNLTSKQGAIPDLDEYAEQEAPEAWYSPLENSDFLKRMRDVIDDALLFELI